MIGHPLLVFNGFLFLMVSLDEARALLGRLEYQRGNVEAALQVFDGIDISTIRSRMKASITSKSSQQRGRSKNDISHPLSLHAASLLLEAIYLKAKSLQKLGRLTDAALECKGILDTVDVVFPQGMPDSLGENLLEKSLHHLEKPNGISALLLAAKLSCEDNDTSSNAMQYAHRAIANMKEDSHSRKCVAYHILGSSMGKPARLASLNTQRAFLQRESLKALQDSTMLDGENPSTYFDLALEYAEQRNLTAALDCAKKHLDLTGGSEVQGWRLLGLILSAQHYDLDAMC
ncbi:hypothetical protein GOP47_0011137 [Adiantum capillus-veneris]|uniref:Uncharacterized protein n=1 Tax=Adiantum capillus-veneris TaxID=13818 RepID=A0A9D4USM5_ADICA|nr:hypothetical protein GOP47_0011137 [Adiantum capillus-veneris]